MNLQTLLDIGAAADPTLALSGLRGGRVFIVDQSEITVAECRAMLDAIDVRYWGEQVMPWGDTRAYAFRVSDEDAPKVREYLGYAHPEAGAQRLVRWLWAIVILCILGAMGCLVAMMLLGGAL